MATLRSSFLTKFPNTPGKVYTSKFYTTDESWPRTNVWWLQIPLTSINREQYDHVNLICQVSPGSDKYHCLKVPTEFLNEHLNKFHRIGMKISLYLSADTESLFLEERGMGRLNFGQYKI